jgi:hypothetical protein
MFIVIRCPPILKYNYSVIKKSFANLYDRPKKATDHANIVEIEEKIIFIRNDSRFIFRSPISIVKRVVSMKYFQYLFNVEVGVFRSSDKILN